MLPSPPPSPLTTTITTHHSPPSPLTTTTTITTHHHHHRRHHHSPPPLTTHHHHSPLTTHHHHHHHHHYNIFPSTFYWQRNVSCVRWQQSTYERCTIAPCIRRSVPRCTYTCKSRAYTQTKQFGSSWLTSWVFGPKMSTLILVKLAKKYAKVS